jgi:hypothetical protein
MCTLHDGAYMIHVHVGETYYNYISTLTKSHTHTQRERERVCTLHDGAYMIHVHVGETYNNKDNVLGFWELYICARHQVLYPII